MQHYRNMSIPTFSHKRIKWWFSNLFFLSSEYSHPCAPHHFSQRKSVTVSIQFRSWLSVTYYDCDDLIWCGEVLIPYQISLIHCQTKFLKSHLTVWWWMMCEYFSLPFNSLFNSFGFPLLCYSKLFNGKPSHHSRIHSLTTLFNLIPFNRAFNLKSFIESGCW